MGPSPRTVPLSRSLMELVRLDEVVLAGDSALSFHGKRAAGDAFELASAVLLA